jgi:hypothetical protein
MRSSCLLKGIQVRQKKCYGLQEKGVGMTSVRQSSRQRQIQQFDSIYVLTRPIVNANYSAQLLDPMWISSY